MLSTNQMLYIFMGVLCLFLVFLIFLFTKSRKREKADRVVTRTKKNGRNYLYGFYLFYSRFPLTKRYFYKISNRVRAIYPADNIAINLRATKTILRGSIAALAMIAGTLVFAKNDLFFVFAGFFMAYIVLTTLVSGSLEAQERRLLLQFKDFIEDVREEYNRVHRVDDAVGNILDQLPYEIGLHAERIYKVLTATQVKKEADKYSDIAPNRFFTTFIAIASTTMEYGDKKIEDGRSLFLKNINFLKEEVNIELLKQAKNSALFSGLSIVALLPVIAIKPIELWATTNIPQLTKYYSGSYGIVCMAIVFALSAISYAMIDNFKSEKEMEIKENSVFKQIASRPAIRRFLNAQVNRNYSKSLKQDEMLRFTGDQLGINTFLLKRYFAAALLILVTTILLFTSIFRSKQDLLTNFVDEFTSSSYTTAEYRDVMRETAKNYTEQTAKMTAKNAGTQEFKENLAADIMKNTDLHDKKLADSVADVVSQRVTKYGDVYFKWYYLIVIIMMGILGYYIPLWLLMFKQSAVRMNMEDEVAQFQTLALIISRVDGANIAMLLEWMDRFAYCFKSSVSQCIIDLPHGGQKALIAMREAEPFRPFKSFVNCMISVDEVGMVTAFSSIETDRAYYKEKRQEDNLRMITRKSTYAKWISIIPLFFVFIFYLIYPMVQFALEMMGQVSSAL